MKALLTLTLLINFTFAIDGYKIYKQKCFSCHAEFIEFSKLAQNFENENRDLKLKAPTINQLSYRLKQMIGDSSDEEFHLFEVSEFIKDYTINPDKSKTKCLDIVMKNFEVMPSLKDKISEEELEAVAQWIYYYDKKEEK